MQITYQDLLKTIKKNRLKVNLKQLDKAYQYAQKAHANQLRFSGDPFISHPLFVANTIASWKLDQTSLEAALLHDVIEDTSVTYQDLEKEFGQQMAFLVDGVTKVGHVKLRNSTETVFIENLRKMFVSMSKDIRVILIRLADRHHNMLTLDAVPIAKQKRIAKETLRIYAPLAERLGIGQLKGVLEDLSFPFAYPKRFKWVTDRTRSHYQKAERYTQQTIKQINSLIKAHPLKVSVHGRCKNKYSLYHKLKRPEINQDINKIHDLVAVRIITKTKQDCYTCLGLVHGHFKPVPHAGISDFIAQPKPNGYQSIHTKVFNHQGHIVEIQIRSQKMHDQAEYGAAAHHAYSDAALQGATQDSLEEGTAFQIDSKMHWIKQLARWQSQVKNSAEFTKGLKLDALSHRIYVFSPLGDVYDLPLDATPVDFAFSVHTDLGFHINSVKVNQKIATLNQPLKSGDIVEVIKSKRKRPATKDWLQFVKSSRAKVKIRKDLSL